MGLGGPGLNGTGQALEAVSVYEKMKGLIDAHPEEERIRRALWLDVVRFVLLDCLWWKNEFDPTEVVRFSRVAAAKMLSQKRLVGVGGEGKELRLKRAEVRGYCVSEGNRPDAVFKIE